MSNNELYELYRPHIDWDAVNDSLEWCLVMFQSGLLSALIKDQNYFDEYHNYSDDVLTPEQSEFYRYGEIPTTDYLEY